VTDKDPFDWLESLANLVDKQHAQRQSEASGNFYEVHWIEADWSLYDALRRTLPDFLAVVRRASETCAVSDTALTDALNDLEARLRVEMQGGNDE